MFRFAKNIKMLISVVSAVCLASSFSFSVGAIAETQEGEIVLNAQSAVCTGKYSLKINYDGKKGFMTVLQSGGTHKE